MNVFSFFLLLFALMAALAKSWRYCAGFALAGIGLWLGLAYLASRPVEAREILAGCNETQEADAWRSTNCIALVMMNLPSPKQENGHCIYDIAVFHADPAAIDPRATQGGGIEGWQLLTILAVDWMNSHPEQLDFPASEVIGNAVASRFPCPASPS